MTRRSLHRTPWPLWLLALCAVAFLLTPLVALFVDAPWGEVIDQLDDPVVRQALVLSLVTATIATALSVVFGVPLAWVLAHGNWRGHRLLRALVVLPLVLPPVVGGVALLLAFGRRGLVGGPLYDWLGVSIPFTPTAVVMAETFVALPFLVLTVEGALRSRERRYEDIAGSLGASRWRVARQVTLPLIAPAIAAGAVLAWARAIGEFGATITFAGNFPG
ncbi:MAG TPA: molybdate ABC transporter permease subunit, partial [Actinomycetes bacterium]|nr:molybdate ABC transporter permease subunit [Actinomycetes bacterium]